MKPFFSDRISSDLEYTPDHGTNVKLWMTVRPSGCFHENLMFFPFKAVMDYMFPRFLCNAELFVKSNLLISRQRMSGTFFLLPEISETISCTVRR